jgi:hypothetical protein
LQSLFLRELGAEMKIISYTTAAIFLGSLTLNEAKLREGDCDGQYMKNIYFI